MKKALLLMAAAAFVLACGTTGSGTTVAVSKIALPTAAFSAPAATVDTARPDRDRTVAATRNAAAAPTAALRLEDQSTAGSGSATSGKRIKNVSFLKDMIDNQRRAVLASNPIDGPTEIPTIEKVRQELYGYESAQNDRERMFSDRLRYQLLHDADDPLANNPMSDYSGSMTPPKAPSNAQASGNPNTAGYVVYSKNFRDQILNKGVNPLDSNQFNDSRAALPTPHLNRRAAANEDARNAAKRAVLERNARPGRFDPLKDRGNPNPL